MAESDPSAAPVSPSTSLLLRLKQRQPEAWQRFLRLYGPLVYSWCRRRWRLAPPDAADLLQEVVARVMETIADYRGGHFIAWLESITRSRVANFYRHNPTRAIGGDEARQRLAEAPDPRPPMPVDPGAASAEDLGGVLRRALDAVRGRCTASSWQAFWQVTVEGRKAADVAADLGITPNAVYIANSRILWRLRAELGTSEHEGPS
jgi:RNA polymerase sigma-70 factor (ECF subfamily)